MHIAYRNEDIKTNLKVNTLKKEVETKTNNLLVYDMLVSEITTGHYIYTRKLAASIMFCFLEVTTTELSLKRC